MYSRISIPGTDKSYHINSKVGRKIIKNYMKILFKSKFGSGLSQLSSADCDKNTDEELYNKFLQIISGGIYTINDHGNLNGQQFKSSKFHIITLTPIDISNKQLWVENLTPLLPYIPDLSYHNTKINIFFQRLYSNIGGNAIVRHHPPCTIINDNDIHFEGYYPKT